MASLEKLYNGLEEIYGAAPYSVEQFKTYASDSAFLGNLYDNISRSGRVNMGNMSREEWVKKLMNATDAIRNNPVSRRTSSFEDSPVSREVNHENNPPGSNQKPHPTTISEEELENSVAEYEESLGHGKYGAVNTPLFQRVRQAATSAEQIANGIVDKDWMRKSPSVSQSEMTNAPEEEGLRQERTPVSDAYKSQFDKNMEDRFSDARTRLENDAVFQFENMLDKLESDIDKNSEWRKSNTPSNPGGDVFKDYTGYKGITEDTLEDLEREGYTPEEIGELSKRRGIQNLTQKYISQARDVIEMYKRKDGSKLANFFDAFARSFDSGILTLGYTDAIDMSQVLSIANKIGDNGEGFEKLTKDEQQLMAAFSLLDQIQGSLQLDTWQYIGQGTMESLSYLAEFAMTGGLGAAASAATKAAAKAAVKKIIGKSATNAVRRAAVNAGRRAAGRVAMNAAGKIGNAATDLLVGGTTMALTSGAGRTAEDVMRRMTGNHDVQIGSNINADGELATDYEHRGVENRESLGTASIKGGVSTGLEYGTEFAGKYMGLGLGRLLSRFKGGRELLAKPLMGKSVEFARKAGRITGFNGFLPEVAEEELGMILNAATIGDVKWEDIADTEQQFQTVMAVGIMSLGFQAANAINMGINYHNYRKAKRSYDSKDFGEGLSSDDIIKRLDNVPLDRREDFVKSMQNTYGLNQDDANELRRFVLARTGYEFILGKIETDAEDAGEAAASAEASLINKEMGGKVTVTLMDGREAILTVGNISLEPNAAGEYTTSNPSGSLIAKPVGKNSTPIMISPKDIKGVSMMSAEDAIGQARAMAEDNVRSGMAQNIETDAAEIEAGEQNTANTTGRENQTPQKPLYSISEVELDDVVTFKDNSDPDNPGVEKTLKVIGKNDSGVVVEDIVYDVPRPLPVSMEQITSVRGKEKAAPVSDTTGGQAGTEAADAAEYARFVNEGIVSDDTISRIATKIANGEQLTQEEEAMRQGAAQRVEDKLREMQQNSSLSAEQSEAFISNMKSLAETAPEIELTPENWLSLFGEEGVVNTPLGKVNIGENQYFKLARQGREGKLGMVKPTLENPDVVVEERSEAKNGEKTERPSSYIFIKSFKKADGSRFYYFTSVTVSKDGNEVVISNQEKSEKRISKLLQNGKIAWINKNVQSVSETQNGKSVPLDDSQAATQADNHTASLGIHSPELSSTNKGNENPAEKQAVGEETDRWAKYRKSNGEIDERKMPLQEQFEYGEEVAGTDAMIEVARAGMKKTQSEIARLEKERDKETSPVKRVNKENRLKTLNERMGIYQQYIKDKESLPEDLEPTDYIPFRSDMPEGNTVEQNQINGNEGSLNERNSLSSQVQSSSPASNSEIGEVSARTEGLESVQGTKSNQNQTENQDEILQSIPQREHGTEAQKDRRMEEAALGLQDRIEEAARDAQEAGRTLSRAERQEIETRAAEEYAPVGKGVFGEIYDQFKGKPREAIDFLMKKKSGEAIGALYHKDVGDIDLVWGKEGTGHSDGFGLAKLVKYHPEVLDDLQDILNDMQVATRNSNRINLESSTHKATIRLEWDGDKKNWLLTAFEKENPASTKTTDTDTTSLRGDTALSQTELSAGKDNTNSSNRQEKARLSTQKSVEERSREIQAYIEQEAGKLNIPVRIVTDRSQISPSEKNYERKLKSQGWYDPDTGEIVIVASNHGSIRDAQRTLLHEAVAHYGLPAMLGREQFDKLCDDVWRYMTDRERAIFGAYTEGKNKKYEELTDKEKARYQANDFSGKRAAADEYMAHFAEQGVTSPTLWSRIKHLLKEAFRKMGFDLNLSDSDIAYLLWKSKNRITDRDNMRTVIDKFAADTRIKKGIEERFRTVYHGSGASFDRFDHSFMGTGEGAQAYGWGTYVTEVEGIGRTYAESMARRGNHITYDGENLGDVLDNEYYFDETWRNWKRHLLSATTGEDLKSRIRNLYFFPKGKGAQKRKQAFEQQKKELLEDIDSGRIKVSLPRNLYTVEIPDDTGKNYLDWEKPVSDSIDRDKLWNLTFNSVLSNGGHDEIEREMLSKDIRDSIDDSETGEDLYKAISLYIGDKEASMLLHGIGFTGISYPAQATTGGRKDGARNYVIFNEDDLQITDHTRFRTSEYTPEEQDIIEQARQNGTYMKAPNGADTNLTPKQWAQVRTRAFKDWFGDWEKAARIEKLRSSEPVEITGNEYKGKYELNRESAQEYLLNHLRGEYEISDTNEKVVLSKVGAKKVTSHSMSNPAHLKSIVAIPDLLKHSIFIEEIPNEKTNGKYDSYRYYIVGLKIGDVDYTARLTIGVKDGKYYYDHYLTEIEKGNLIEIANGFTPTGDLDVPVPSYTKSKDKRLLSLLQVNSSKFVDENGEPMVVYHGTPLRRDQITPNKGWQKDGTYINQEAPFYTFKGGEYSGMIFASVDAEKARSIAEKRAMSIPDDTDGTEQWTEEGYVYDLFANVKNPFVPQSDADIILSSLGDEISTLSFYGGQGETVSAETAKEILNSGNSWLVTETPQFVAEIKRLGYDGLTGTDEGVDYIACFNPNQLKDAYDNTGTFSTENDDIRFRINTPVEQRGDLVAIHNTSEDKLKEAMELGGFPMPSIAITKPEVGHTTFGDISLVFGKETINPADRRNKVYGEDAWTPMFPAIGYKLNDDKTSDIYRRANKAGKLPLFNPVNFHPDNYENHISGLDSESLIRHFIDDYDAKQLYLSEKGNPVEQFEEHEVEKYSAERVAFLEKVLNDIGLERLLNDRYEAIENDVKRILSEHYHVDFEKLPPFRAKVRIDNAIRQAVGYATNGNRKTEADVEATKKKIDERVDQNKFEEWLRDLFDEITLDNVVKAMQKQSAKGGQGLFGGSIFGAAQSEFKNIGEIREAARERIRESSDEGIDEKRREITERLSQIDIPMKNKNETDTFDMIENIIDAVRHSHTPRGIYNFLHDIYPGMTMDIADEIVDIVKDIQQMSARFFEAKPYRAVGFNEIKFAVVPDNVDADLLSQLQSMKIPVETYENGNIEQRKQVLNEASGKYDTRFRTIVVNPHYGSTIETVRNNHTQVYKAVDRYIRDNFDAKDYTTHTARTGSRYLELNIGNDTLKVRFANHTPRMEVNSSIETLGNGKEITFFPDGSIDVNIDISLSGDRSKEITGLIEGIRKYSSSELKKEVARLVEGAKSSSFPDIANPQTIEKLGEYIGTELARELNGQIAESYKRRIDTDIDQQDTAARNSKLKQDKYIWEHGKSIFHDFVQESPNMIKAVGGGYWYKGTAGTIRIIPPLPVDNSQLAGKLMSSHFIPLPGVNKKAGKRQAVREYVDEWTRRLTDSGIFLSEEYVEEGTKITAAQQEADHIREQYNFWVKAKLDTGNSTDTRFREAAPDVSSYIKVTTENKAVVDLTALPQDQAERIRRNAKAAYGAEISEDGNQAIFPDYQEAENCLVYIFTNADVIADNIQESINNGTLPQDISMILDADLRRGMARRVWIDQYQPLEALQKLITKTLGKGLTEAEDAWEYTGFMDSRIKSEADEYNTDYYLPLLELYQRIIRDKNGVDEDILVDYMLIKHGIERNQVMRREALEEWEKEHQGARNYDERRTEYIQELSTHDYSGYFERFKKAYAYNYATAEDFIAEVESLLGEDTVIDLWRKIKKATNKTLDISVQSGLISMEDAATYKKRFQFYVPLRGFSEDTMEQIYDSNVRINPGSTVNKQAKGRTSRADNPLVSIMAMANTEIARANRNKMKQRLLTLLTDKEVRDWFSYSYEVEYKDGRRESLKYKPKLTDDIKEIITLSNVYQIVPKYEVAALDANGNPILDENGNKTWIETDETPSAEQLESGLARFSKAYSSNRSNVYKTASQMSESIVDVFVAGKKVSIIFTNPLIANAINGRLNLDRSVPRKIETPDEWYDIPGWLTFGARHLGRQAARATRKLSQFYTTYSPAFVLFSNFARDFSGAFAYNSAEKSIAEARKIAMLAPQSAAAMTRYVRGKAKNKRYTPQEIEQFLARIKGNDKITKEDYDIAVYLFVTRGAETGYISANSVDEYRKSIAEALRYGTVNVNKQGKAMKKGYMAGVKALQDMARIMESITRLDQFVAALREGKSVDKAVTEAKNVSTNFNRRGSHEGVQWLFDNYAFLNASLQGTDRLLRGIKKNPLGFAKVIGRIIGVGVLNGLIFNLFFYDDERWGNAYHSLPEYKRYNNLVIPAGKDKFIFIPLAQSLRGFHAWGVMLADLMTGYHKRHPLVSDPITPLDFLGVIGQDIVPITYGSWTNAAPTALQPVAHIVFNENFMGRPLYKENPWNENQPEFRKAYGSTPKGLVKWSEFVNRITGGNYAEKGWLEQIPVLEKLNNPAVLQQLYLGYAPGLFRVAGQIYNAADAVYTKLQDKPTDFSLSDVPAAGAILGDANDRIPKAKLRNKWYDLLDEAKEYKRVENELSKHLFIDDYIEAASDKKRAIRQGVVLSAQPAMEQALEWQREAARKEEELLSEPLSAGEAIEKSAQYATLRKKAENLMFQTMTDVDRYIQEYEERYNVK